VQDPVGPKANRGVPKPGGKMKEKKKGTGELILGGGSNLRKGGPVYKDLFTRKKKKKKRKRKAR